MSNSQFLFLVACLPARALLAYLVYQCTRYQKQLGSVLTAIGVAFLYLYATNSRMDAMEADGGVTWWHPLRLWHGLLYVTAGLLLFSGHNQSAGLVLVLDLLLGAGAHINRYYV
jgi:hypothetical protein